MYRIYMDTALPRSGTSRNLLAKILALAALPRAELARRARTSRPTLSAYVSGAKSPTLRTAERIAEAAGLRLDVVPDVVFGESDGPRAHHAYVPNTLPRLPVEQAFRQVTLPLHLNWSAPGRVYDLARRRDRARVYEIVLREGTPDDILRYVDGALLRDLWTELILPEEIRAAWAPVVMGREAAQD